MANPKSSKKAPSTAKAKPTTRSAAKKATAPHVAPAVTASDPTKALYIYVDGRVFKLEQGEYMAADHEVTNKPEAKVPQMLVEKYGSTLVNIKEQGGIGYICYLVNLDGLADPE